MFSITAQIKDQPCEFAKITLEIRFMIHCLCVQLEWKANDKDFDFSPHIIDNYCTTRQEACFVLYGECTFFIRLRNEKIIE